MSAPAPATPAPTRRQSRRASTSTATASRHPGHRAASPRATRGRRSASACRRPSGPAAASATASPPPRPTSWPAARTCATIEQQVLASVIQAYVDVSARHRGPAHPPGQPGRPASPAGRIQRPLRGRRDHPHRRGPVRSPSGPVRSRSGQRPGPAVGLARRLCRRRRPGARPIWTPRRPCRACPTDFDAALDIGLAENPGVLRRRATACRRPRPRVAASARRVSAVGSV